MAKREKWEMVFGDGRDVEDLQNFAQAVNLLKASRVFVRMYTIGDDNGWAAVAGQRTDLPSPKEFEKAVREESA